MPFCPTCRYEYVEGITTCPDCDSELVPELREKPSRPKPAMTQPSVDWKAVQEEPLELVEAAEFMFPMQAEMAKLHLEMEGIKSTLSGEIVTLTRPGLEAFPIRLMVRKEDLERAREVLSSKMQE